jgi:hypothetical protein
MKKINCDVGYGVDGELYNERVIYIYTTGWQK